MKASKVFARFSSEVGILDHVFGHSKVGVMSISREQKVCVNLGTKPLQCGLVLITFRLGGRVMHGGSVVQQLSFEFRDY
ncbi:MAG: hypothetical protein WCA00_01625 [Candidatus Acidiferrales bacterium]